MNLEFGGQFSLAELKALNTSEPEELLTENEEAEEMINKTISAAEERMEELLLLQKEWVILLDRMDYIEEHTYNQVQLLRQIAQDCPTYSQINTMAGELKALRLLAEQTQKEWLRKKQTLQEQIRCEQTTHEQTTEEQAGKMKERHFSLRLPEISFPKPTPFWFIPPAFLLTLWVVWRSWATISGFLQSLFL